MIRILLVDDNQDKVANILAVIQAVLPSEDFALTVCRTVVEAGKSLSSESFDLLLLDVQLPQRVGEDPDPLAGTQFLEQLYNSWKYLVPRYIVGITAFDDHFERVKKQFEDRMWHLVKYDPRSDEWSRKLTAILLHLGDPKRGGEGGYETDIAIITALDAIEFDAVLKLPAKWQERPVDGDATIYHHGVFSRDQSSLTVVAASALEMGMPASTALAMKMILHFRPRYIVMLGIAAGVEGDFGDILVADVAFDYGSGRVEADKLGERHFSPDPHPIPMDAALKAKLSAFKRETAIIERIRTEAVGADIPNKLNVRIGPMASGAAVVKDRTIVDEVQALWRKLVGVEMETYGVFVAARNCPEPRPQCASIKSLCDYADPAKKDAYQRYAAYTSATFFYEFALTRLT